MALSFQNKIRPVATPTDLAASSVSFADKIRPAASVEVASPEDRATKIANLRTKAAGLEATAKKEAGIFPQAKTFGTEVLKGLGKAVASSEIGLGESVAKIANTGNRTKMANENIQNLTAGQIKLADAIKKAQEEGRDISSLRDMFNKYAGLIAQNRRDINATGAELPTNGKVAGQLGGTALDLLTAGTYKGVGGQAANVIKNPLTGSAWKVAAEGSFKLAPTALNAAQKGIGTILPEVGQVLRQVPGSFTTKSGLWNMTKNSAKGAAIGYGYDVSQGLQEGETSGKQFIPGQATLAGSLLPVAMGLERTGKELFTKSGQTALALQKETTAITKRKEGLDKLFTGNKNTALYDLEESARKKTGMDLRTEIAESSLLDGAVNNRGVINTREKGGPVEFINGVIGEHSPAIVDNLRREGNYVDINDVEKHLLDGLKTSNLSGTKYTDAKAAIAANMNGLRSRAVDMGMPDGRISLADTYESAVGIGNSGNWNDTNAAAIKEIAMGMKDFVSKNTKSVDVQEVNNALTRLYDMRDALIALNGQKVAGGTLGRMAKGTLGAIFGMQAGPVGSAAGASLLSRLQGMQLTKALGPNVGRVLETSPILQKATADAAAPVAAKFLLGAGDRSKIPIPQGPYVQPQAQWEAQRDAAIAEMNKVYEQNIQSTRKLLPAPRPIRVIPRGANIDNIGPGLYIQN